VLEKSHRHNNNNNNNNKMTETKKESVIEKFFAVNSKPTFETFPELPDAVVWMRFVLALLYGGWLGLGTQRGGAGVIFGLNFIAFVPILYCNTFLGADGDSYGTKIYVSGVANSLGLMLLIWIYFHTLEHEGDEKMLAFALRNALSGSMDTSDEAGTDYDGIVVDEPVVVIEESEF
jgi:hypothetical protein